MNLILSLVLSGYGFAYNGCEGRNYYFEVNTPKIDYGFVVEMTETPKVYCDVISQKS